MPAYFPGQADNISDADIFKSNTLWNYENPQFAVDNIFRAMGANPYAANPYLQTVRSASGGLANAYLLQKATTPGQTNTWGDDFRNFLSGALSPGSLGRPSPGFYATLQNAQAQLPQAIQTVRQLGMSGNAQNINPYAWALQQRLGADQGRGTLEFLQSVNNPLMSRQLRSAYGQGLEGAYSQGMYNYANSPNHMQGDVWSYLLGY